MRLSDLIRVGQRPQARCRPALRADPAPGRSHRARSRYFRQTSSAALAPAARTRRPAAAEPRYGDGVRQRPRSRRRHGAAPAAASATGRHTAIPRAKSRSAAWCTRRAPIRSKSGMRVSDLIRAGGAPERVRLWLDRRDHALRGRGRHAPRHRPAGSRPRPPCSPATRPRTSSSRLSTSSASGRFRSGGARARSTLRARSSSRAATPSSRARSSRACSRAPAA